MKHMTTMHKVNPSPHLPPVCQELESGGWWHYEVQLPLKIWRKMLDHIRNCHMDSGVCKTCGKYFSSRKKLVNHQCNLYTLGSPARVKFAVSASRCSWSWSSTWSETMTIWEGNCGFRRCPKCTKRFLANSVLTIHVEMSHSNRLRPQLLPNIVPVQEEKVCMSSMSCRIQEEGQPQGSHP